MPRMIFDIPNEVQMAIRLAAVKAGKTTGEIVAEAIRYAFPGDVKEAIESIVAIDAARKGEA